MIANGAKKILFLSVAAIGLAGCSALPQKPGSAGSNASIFRSNDSGATFESKISIEGETTTLSGVDVLSWEFHPTNSGIIYIGTLKDGMYRTTNQGESWQKMYFPPVKAYGLAVDPSNGDRIYASGVYEDVSKLYLSENAGNDWKEIYTEPGKGTVIIALAVNPHNTNHILAANSKGVVIESMDKGSTWKNVNTFDGPVTQITFMKKAPGSVLVLVKGEDIVVSQDNGLTWPKQETGGLPVVVKEVKDFDEAENQPIEPSGQNVIVVDHEIPGLLYTGTNEGLYRSRDYGTTWEMMNILESSKSFPIRAVAVNPKNSQEIVYTAGSAFYRTLDGGEHWATTKLPINRPVNILRFDPQNPSTLFVALKKQ